MGKKSTKIREKIQRTLESKNQDKSGQKTQKSEQKLRKTKTKGAKIGQRSLKSK